MMNSISSWRIFSSSGVNVGMKNAIASGAARATAGAVAIARMAAVAKARLRDGCWFAICRVTGAAIEVVRPPTGSRVCVARREKASVSSKTSEDLFLPDRMGRSEFPRFAPKEGSVASERLKRAANRLHG